MRFLWKIAVAFVGMGLAADALMAADLTTAADDEDAPSSRIFSSQPAKDWIVKLGARGRIVPAVAGEEKLKPGFVPYNDVRYKDLSFLTSERGLGVNLTRFSSLIAGGDRLTSGVSFNAENEKALIRSQSQNRFVSTRGQICGVFARFYGL